jgi:hypothetical protein
MTVASERTRTGAPAILPRAVRRRRRRAALALLGSLAAAWPLCAGTVPSAEDRAAAERSVREFLDAVRRERTTATRETYIEICRVTHEAAMAFRVTAGRVGEPALEAFEREVLKEIRGASRWWSMRWRPYVYAASLDRPEVGRERLNRFLKEPSLTKRMRATIFYEIPPQARAANWIDERFALRTLLGYLDDKEVFRTLGCFVGSRQLGTPVRYCDAAFKMIAGWYSPPGVKGVDFLSDEFIDPPSRDPLVARARRWAESRLRRLDAREAILSALGDWRAMGLRRKEMAALGGAWMALEDRGTVPNLRDIKALLGLLLDEFARRREPGEEPGEAGPEFVEEAGRMLGVYFREAVGGIDGPSSEDLKRPASLIAWTKAAAERCREAVSMREYGPIQFRLERREFDVFRAELERMEAGLPADRTR